MAGTDMPTAQSQAQGLEQMLLHHEVEQFLLAGGRRKVDLPGEEPRLGGRDQVGEVGAVVAMG